MAVEPTMMAGSPSGAVLHQERLEPRMVADRVPERMAPQAMDRDVGGDRQEPRKLIARAPGVAKLGEDQGPIFGKGRAPDRVFAIEDGLLEPASLAQPLAAPPEAGQG